MQNLGSLLGDCVWSSKKREPETITGAEIETETERYLSSRDGKQISNHVKKGKLYKFSMVIRTEEKN